MIVIKVRELNDFYQAYRMSATYLRSPTDPNSGRSISFCDFAYLEQDPSRMDCTMIYRFSRCQMPIRGPALYHNSPANINRAALNLHQPIIPSNALFPRRRSSYFDIRSCHFNVNFCPAITGAVALDLEFAFPHMAHASDLSVHD